MKKGLFITIEGPDGSGKTTASTKIIEALEKEGIDVVYTREPGGIDIAEQIRSVILNPENTKMDGKTEALLYAAARRQHLVEKVIPAVKANKLVLCDRFVDSSLAYQGNARGLGIDEVLSINNFAIDGTWPDLTIYLDIDEQVGLQRVEGRGAKDRLDAESEQFHHLVVEGYKIVVDRFKDRIKIVDASQSPEKVASDCLDIIHKYIND